jgi:ABC-type branched-subunit amino acid transport system ATPase component
MENGRIALSEEPEKLSDDPRILQSYLGISREG